MHDEVDDELLRETDADDSEPLPGEAEDDRLPTPTAPQTIMVKADKSETETADMIMEPPKTEPPSISEEEYQALKKQEADTLHAQKPVAKPPRPGLVPQMRQANVSKENQKMVLQLLASGKTDLAEDLVLHLTAGQTQANAKLLPAAAPTLECDANSKTRDAFAIKLLEKQRPLGVPTFLRAVFKYDNLEKLPTPAYQILIHTVDQILDPNTDSADATDLDSKSIRAVPSMKRHGLSEEKTFKK